MVEDNDPRAAALSESLATRYREIAATSMADMPICNRALGVAAEGFRVHAGRAVGIVVTPWFMNIVATDLPDGPPSAFARPGTSCRLALPRGEVDVIVGELPGVGRIDSCSLFSPMHEFADMAAAVETAREAMRALFEPEPPPATPALDRRSFLRGGRPTAEGAAP